MYGKQTGLIKKGNRNSVIITFFIEIDHNTDLNHVEEATKKLGYQQKICLK